MYSVWVSVDACVRVWVSVDACVRVCVCACVEWEGGGMCVCLNQMVQLACGENGDDDSDNCGTNKPNRQTN
jgi:hypothetical protein